MNNGKIKCINVTNESKTGAKFTKDKIYNVTNNTIVSDNNVTVLFSDIFNLNDLFDATFEIAINISEDNAEEIYKEKELAYLIQDAENHCDEYLESNNDSNVKIVFNNDDYEALAKLFLDKKDCNVADNETWACIIQEYIKNMMKNDTLEDYVSKDGSYIIPVEWAVYSTVKVEADNLKQAIEIARNCIDDLPITADATYIDGSYIIVDDSDEDFLNAQFYEHISNINIDKNGKITS